MDGKRDLCKSSLQRNDRAKIGLTIKLYSLPLMLLITAPAHARRDTMLGMIFTVVFIVIMLVLYWIIVAEVGKKDKS